MDVNEGTDYTNFLMVEPFVWAVHHNGVLYVEPSTLI